MSIKCLGVFTSGGDSPGMNACVRAVVRAAAYNNVGVKGIMRGYQGMIEGEIRELGVRDVSNIIQRGGTILKSARSKSFHEKEFRVKAFQNLQSSNIDALVAIGGDGTFTGADIFAQEFKIPVIGIPGTIDNDLFGTDFTLGFDTAVNTAIESIDKLRDTAASHDRVFFVEVMGRDAGNIALYAGVGGGAEAILMPETPTNIDQLVELLNECKFNRKTSKIVIVAEGDEAGGAQEIADKVMAKSPELNSRVTILGHVQRGGSPSSMDRMLGTRLGVAAVDALISGKTSKMAGVINNKVVFTEFSKAVKAQLKPDPEILRCAKITAI